MWISCKKLVEYTLRYSSYQLIVCLLSSLCIVFSDYFCFEQLDKCLLFELWCTILFFERVKKPFFLKLVQIDSDNIFKEWKRFLNWELLALILIVLLENLFRLLPLTLEDGSHWQEQVLELETEWSETHFFRLCLIVLRLFLIELEGLERLILRNLWLWLLFLNLSHLLFLL